MRCKTIRCRASGCWSSTGRRSCRGRRWCSRCTVGAEIEDIEDRKYGKTYVDVVVELVDVVDVVVVVHVVAGDAGCSHVGLATVAGFMTKPSFRDILVMSSYRRSKKQAHFQRDTRIHYLGTSLRLQA